jgi:hypothetical protein
MAYRGSTIRTAFLLAAAAVGGGCTTLPADPDYPGPVPPASGLAARFDYVRDPSVPHIDFDPPLEGGGVVRRDGRMYLPRSGRITPGWRPVRYWLPAAADAGDAAPVPAVLVLPMLGGPHPLIDSLCRSLAGHGFAAFQLGRVFRDIHTGQSPERLEAALVEGTLEARRALDWLESRPEIDPTRLGAAGISLGGIRLAILAAVEPRLRASVIAFAGADLAEILSDSAEPAVAAYREAVMARDRLDAEGFRARCRRALLSDPLHLAGHIDARRTLLVLGDFDGAVPARSGELLGELIGGPETIRLPTGHWGAFFFFNFLRGPVMEFLDRRFAAPA